MAGMDWGIASASDLTLVLPPHSFSPQQYEYLPGEYWDVNRVYSTDDLLNSIFKNFTILVDLVDSTINYTQAQNPLLQEMGYGSCEQWKGMTSAQEAGNGKSELRKG